MSYEVSFTKIENELTPAFRERMKGAEGVADVRRIFAEFVQEMLSRISGAKVLLDEGDVRVEAEAEGGFTLGPGIAQNPDFGRFLERSDLLDILRRQGRHAANKITHLGKGSERDQTKLFPRKNRRG